jgi:hypothetical protein
LGESGWEADQVPGEPDVTDEYVLSRPAEPQEGRVMIELREMGAETTSLDRVGVIAYEVPQGMSLGRIVPESRTGLISQENSISAVRDRQGRDVTRELSELDGLVVEGNAGDHVEFSLVKGLQARSPIIEIIKVNARLKQPPLGGWEGGGLLANERAGIVLQAHVGDAWIDVAGFVPRERGEAQCVPITAVPGQPGEVVRVRLQWRAHHELDSIGLGVWTEAEGTSLNLVRAVHSTRGDARTQLLVDDQVYETIGPSEGLRCEFEGLEQTEHQKLCLVTRGHYVFGFPLDGEKAKTEQQAWTPSIKVDDRLVEEVTVSPVPRVYAFPNPSSGPFTIQAEFDSSELVEVVIYSIDGHLLRRLHAGPIEAGKRRFTWDGRNEAGKVLPSGQYYYRIAGGSWAKSGKVFLLK